MLVKLTPVVNFINILQAAFVPIFLHQKLQRQTVTKRKAAQSTFIQKVTSKMLIYILRAAFAPIFLHQIFLKSNCKVEKRRAKHFCTKKIANKMLMKKTRSNSACHRRRGANRWIRS